MNVCVFLLLMLAEARLNFTAEDATSGYQYNNSGPNILDAVRKVSLMLLSFGL